MSNRIRWFLVLCVILSCAAVILLYSGTGPMPASNMGGGKGAWSGGLALFANLFTVPISTSEIAEIRLVVLMVGLAVLLLILAAIQWRAGNGARDAATLPPGAPTPVRGETSVQGKSPSAKKTSGDAISKLSATASGGAFAEYADVAPNIGLRWMVACGAAVLIIGTLSAFANHSWALSWGWMVRTAAGLIWAVVLAMKFDAVMARRAMTGLIIVGVAACSLALWHRANRQLDLFIWPIGPVTPTATFSAVWAALALGQGAGFLMVPGRRLHAIAQFGLGAAFLFVLFETERRGQVLAVVGAAVGLSAFALWLRARTRQVRIVLVVLVVAALATAGAYVGRELLSGNREASGSIGLRLEYWRLSLNMILDRISLGAGPDSFVTEMTNAIAPLRGLSPHVYHGSFDPEAHNEWIQAAVELGVPGALFWLALPLGVLYFACRPRWSASAASSNGRADSRPPVFGPPSLRPLRLALAAGVICIVLAECSGIMLRGPLLPIWYWTLLGLLAATGRSGFEWGKVATERPTTYNRAAIRRLSAILLVGFSGALIAVSVNELGGAQYSESLYTNRTLFRWRVAADDASARVAAGTTPPATAVALWQQLYVRIPGWTDVCAQYADALRLAGNESTARIVLEEPLRRNLNAYEPHANVLFAEQFTDDPRQKLLCVVRALRHINLDSRVAAILQEIQSADVVTQTLELRLPGARQGASASTPAHADDDFGEWLRIQAFFEKSNGDLNAAIDAQKLAAGWYLGLEQRNDRYRRGHDAEIDACLTLARDLHDAGPERIAEAYAAIREAERFAVLSIAHERVADPDPRQGFVGGEVVPTEFPERFYPLWRLSALLHVEMGDDGPVVLLSRIVAFIPMGQWKVPGVIERAQAEIYHAAVQDLSKLPPERRPTYFSRLVRNAGGDH